MLDEICNGNAVTGITILHVIAMIPERRVEQAYACLAQATGVLLYKRELLQFMIATDESCCNSAEHGFNM